MRYECVTCSIWRNSGYDGGHVDKSNVDNGNGVKRKKKHSFRQRLGYIIFRSDTPAARGFDIALLWAILLSVLLVMLESVPSVNARYEATLIRLEWAFTVLFTVEYAARVYSANRRWRYLRSFYGIIDLLAILPSYLSLVVVDWHYLAVVRALRLLRIFRVLKLSRYLGEASVLREALRASRIKIVVFVYTVLTIVMVVGSVMYLVEGPQNGYTSIPLSIYWAIVTLTTVGYGDIHPKTALGQMISSLLMIIGYGIIAVPTGIVTSELSRASQRAAKRCEACGAPALESTANFCSMCGKPLAND